MRKAGHRQMGGGSLNKCEEVCVLSRPVRICVRVHALCPLECE